IVCGLGRFGLSIVELLSNAGKFVVVIQQTSVHRTAVFRLKNWVHGLYMAIFVLGRYGIKQAFPVPRLCY
ncbi:MAG: NAD-binding protein, partial [Pirellulales bacterium]|nr:NAD-binding protein [Pirellulales bacterium]